MNSMFGNLAGGFSPPLLQTGFPTGAMDGEDEVGWGYPLGPRVVKRDCYLDRY